MMERPPAWAAPIIPISQYLDEYQVKSFGIPEKTGKFENNGDKLEKPNDNAPMS